MTSSNHPPLSTHPTTTTNRLYTGNTSTPTPTTVRLIRVKRRRSVSPAAALAVSDSQLLKRARPTSSSTNDNNTSTTSQLDEISPSTTGLRLYKRIDATQSHSHPNHVLAQLATQPPVMLPPITTHTANHLQQQQQSTIPETRPVPGKDSRRGTPIATPGSVLRPKTTTTTTTTTMLNRVSIAKYFSVSTPVTTTTTTCDDPLLGDVVEVFDMIQSTNNNSSRIARRKVNVPPHKLEMDKLIDSMRHTGIFDDIPRTSVNDDDDDGYVYDVYRADATSNDAMDVNELAASGAVQLVLDGDDDGTGADEDKYAEYDDEDSNDENHWANEYPDAYDESEHGSDLAYSSGNDFDPYGDADNHSDF